MKMGLVLAIVLAIVLLDSPWNWVVIAVGFAWELGETALLFWWSKRRRAVVGAEALVGRRALVSADCEPAGQVRVAGEIWGARCEAGARVGDEVVVREVRGLLLVVELPGDG